MLESYKWIGLDGRKSLKGVILRAPLCGANNITQTNLIVELTYICDDLNYSHTHIYEYDSLSNLNNSQPN